MKTVTFLIISGQVEIEASGFKGGACDAATKAFEEILGTLGKKRRKTEYYAQAAPELIKVGKGGT